MPPMARTKDKSRACLAEMHVDAASGTDVSATDAAARTSGLARRRIRVEVLAEIGQLGSPASHSKQDMGRRRQPSSTRRLTLLQASRRRPVSRARWPG